MSTLLDSWLFWFGLALILFAIIAGRRQRS